MKYQVYIVNGRGLESAIYYGDYEEYRDLLGKYPYYTIEEFKSFKDAEMFIRGLYFGLERAPADFVVLRSWHEADRVYIDITENI